MWDRDIMGGGRVTLQRVSVRAGTAGCGDKSKWGGKEQEEEKEEMEEERGQGGGMSGGGGGGGGGGGAGGVDLNSVAR